MVEAVDDVEVATPRRSRVALVAAVAVAVLLAVLIWILFGSDPAQDRATQSPLNGRLAPVILGTTLDGSAFDLDDHQGRWVVVNFFATWCAPCRAEHPELVSFARRHAQAGDAVVVSVAYDDSTDELSAWFEDNGGDWPVVVGDAEHPVANVALDYGVAGVPESYLVDPSGIVRCKITGGVTSTGLDRFIDALDAEPGSVCR
ncbi:MAG: TlpA family protein disulfide reductase [Acidimicrobiales bacterium]